MSTPGPSDPATFPALLGEYLEGLRARNFSPHTLRQARYGILPFLHWLRVRYRVQGPERLRRLHLEAWQRRLGALRTTRGRPLKARSINKKVEGLKGFLRHLAARGYLHGSLAEALHYVKEPHLLGGSVLSHQQVRALLGAIDTSRPEGFRDRAMLELLYSSGLRVAELLGLDLQGVDFAHHTALVMGKGAKERVVPIGRTALGFLETYLKAVRPFLCRAAQEPALFLDRSGKRMPYHTFRRLLGAYAQRSGLEVHVTPHTFRRSCATEMLRGGANLYHVKELLGHENLDTLKHYARLTITDLIATHRRCHPREQEMATEADTEVD